MLKPFLRVRSMLEARELLSEFEPLGPEFTGMDDCLFRVLAESVTAAEEMPPFDRSTMDGFAVSSRDTFGATESSPGLLTLVGEVGMGELPTNVIGRGQTIRIWTGGALPKNADAVVMLEHTEALDDHTLEIYKAVAPFENVVRRGEDFRAGETLLGSGHRLLPQDIGLLAAMGRTAVSVFKRPAVALISSGDEIVPVDQIPEPGCLRDVNRHSLWAMAREAHASPIWIGIARDTLDDVASAIDKGLHQADLVIISGGSSMGSRDYVIEAIKAYPDSQILLHGVSVSPGKPLIAARIGSKPVIGLPGHPVSAMVCFEQFVVPLLRRLEGEAALGPYPRRAVTAVLARNCPSREGRTDFLRVRLARAGGILTAVPVPGKSGMISSMVRAHGFVRVQSDCEGIYKGDQVTVHLFAPWLEENIEEEHISGHETAGGGSGDLFESSRQERLSRL